MELLEILLVYLDHSRFTMKEIAWRVGVHEKTVLNVYRDCMKLYPEWVRATFHNHSFDGQARNHHRRLPLLQVAIKMSRIYGSKRGLALKIKDLRQQRQHLKGRRRKESRNLDINASS
jgi:hypothetical protein